MIVAVFRSRFSPVLIGVSDLVLSAASEKVVAL